MEMLARWVLKRRFLQFDSGFADSLQRRTARRSLAVGSLLFLVILGLPPAWLIWTALSAMDGVGLSDGSRWHLIFPASGPYWLAYAAAAFLLYFFFVPIWERVLYLAVRFAIPVPGYTFDEHQQSVLVHARVAAQPFVLAAMILAMTLGTGMIAAASAGWPTSVPLYAWVCVTSGLSATSAPLLLLVWRLPDDTLTEIEAAT
jgi:hypothetical protein